MRKRERESQSKCTYLTWAAYTLLYFMQWSLNYHIAGSKNGHNPLLTLLWFTANFSLHESRSMGALQRFHSRFALKGCCMMESLCNKLFHRKERTERKDILSFTFFLSCKVVQYTMPMSSDNLWWWNWCFCHGAFSNFSNTTLSINNPTTIGNAQKYQVSVCISKMKLFVGEMWV